MAVAIEVKGQSKSVTDLVELLQIADSGRIIVGDLPKDCGSLATLAAALHDGLIEFGLPETVSTIDKETKRVITVADTGRLNWTDLRGPNRKPLRDLLAEHKDDKGQVARLHVRLTTKGLGSTI